MDKTKPMEGLKGKGKGKGKARLQPLHLLQLPAAPAYGRAQRSLIGGGACGMRRGRRGDGGGGGTRHALLELCQWKLGARVALGEQVEDGQQRLCRGGSWGRRKDGGGGGGGRARAGWRRYRRAGGGDAWARVRVHCSRPGRAGHAFGRVFGRAGRSAPFRVLGAPRGHQKARLLGGGWVVSWLFSPPSRIQLLKIPCDVRDSAGAASWLEWVGISLRGCGAMETWASR